MASECPATPLYSGMHPHRWWNIAYDFVIHIESSNRILYNGTANKYKLEGNL